jgi:DNA-binding IclR family transcriptional regulator
VRLDEHFHAPDIAERIGRPRQRVNELLRELRRFGMIDMIEDARGPNPARWQLRHPRLPAAAPVLPDPSDIA